MRCQVMNAIFVKKFQLIYWQWMRRFKHIFQSWMTADAVMIHGSADHFQWMRLPSAMVMLQRKQNFFNFARILNWKSISLNNSSQHFGRKWNTTAPFSRYVHSPCSSSLATRLDSQNGYTENKGTWSMPTWDAACHALLLDLKKLQRQSNIIHLTDKLKKILIIFYVILQFCW